VSRPVEIWADSAGVAHYSPGADIATTSQRLDALRNTAGSGHDRSTAPDVSFGQALLAGSAATDLIEFLLDSA
jgi:hypothetical protein